MAQADILADPQLVQAGSRFVDWVPVGNGGSAVVYKVFDTELGIPLAIKILKHDHRADPRYVKSLRREVLISRRLRHCNICPIHDLYEGDRGIGIVMDLIEGHDLKQWLKEHRGTLLETMPARLDLFRKLCGALTVAHSLIIHRDLKPANIFLRKGDIGNPVIMDFGLSTPDDADNTHQLEGGTPKYMAPEQFLRLDLDQRADIFALGIMAYELLTDGQIPPCSLRDVHKTGTLPLFKVEDIVPPSTFCAAIPPELDRLVLTMIEHDRTCRPSSAAEISAVLDYIKLLDPFRPLIALGTRETAVRVAEGNYIVGEKSGRGCDQPQRKIRLSSFRIAVHPVTNADYRRFLSATGYRAPALIDHALFGRDSHPVVMVSWEDAVTYARWAGGRLPMEVEWEVAARSGEVRNSYPWGEQPPRALEANIDNLSGGTTPVGSYRAGINAWGLADCCGNVWEWCADTWNEDLLRTATDGGGISNELPGVLKSMRGGSFDSPLAAGRTSFRRRMDGQARRSDVGFRIVFGES